VIRSFRCRETERVFQGYVSRVFPPEIQVRARQRLRLLHGAAILGDLAAIQGNRFEALQGARAGEYSIRINRQWRITFKWDNGPFDVRIEDYH
jgi:proteic killer suppression protein